jgi:hypothetical protein
MKVRLMTKVSAATLISAIACSIFTGCTEKDLYNPERGKTELKPESEYFDFATTAQVAFDVNYGKIAGGALIEVFTEDPITYQTNNYKTDVYNEINPEQRNKPHRRRPQKPNR